MSRPDASGDTEMIRFRYDSGGHRIGKDSGVYHASYSGGEIVYAGETTRTSYSYLGDTLTQVRIVEPNSSATLHFTYDEIGPMSVTYDGAEYFYLKNAQGDVTGLVNSSGTQVVAYTYDAWGNPLTTTGTMADTLGKLNPFRYRGYVYDTETGLYYLQSRYYNPETGRFINADNLVDTEDLLGENLFAYCANNPVNHQDPSGHSFLGIIALNFARVAVTAIAAIAVAGLTVAAVNSPSAKKAANTIANGITKAYTKAKETVSNVVQSAVAKLAPHKKTSEQERERAKTAPAEAQQYSYWEATRVKDRGDSQVVIGKGITLQEASARVSMGLDLMCANENAAKTILLVNGYANAVGPEIHGVGYFPHYHPNRNSHTHIWFFP